MHSFCLRDEVIQRVDGQGSQAPEQVIRLRGQGPEQCLGGLGHSELVAGAPFDGHDSMAEPQVGLHLGGQEVVLADLALELTGA